jgi:membrane-associated protein
MDYLKIIINYILHLDIHIEYLFLNYGYIAYIFIFFIIFAETGLVIFPFLPGDSLLFITGALSGAYFINFWIVFIVFLLGAILGDTVNYSLGYYFGKKIFANEKSNIFKKEYLEKTTEFYIKHGSKTIILARFFPIIRTFAPFVAGIGRMEYALFIRYNLIGGLLWVSLFTIGGYFLGSISLIKDNIHYAVFIIILVSLIPILIELVMHKKNKSVNNVQNSELLNEITSTFKK